MIGLIKPYVNAVIAGLILSAVGYVWWIHHDRNSIKAEFAIYKGEINDQVAKNKAEAAATKKRQDAEYQSAQASHKSDLRRLTAIIKRLRDSQDMPRGEPMPVADGGSVPVSAAPEDPARADATPPLGVGLEQTPFYEAAMMDTLQCRDLMSFVKTLHCVISPSTAGPR